MHKSGDDSPELQLSKLLQSYRQARGQRLANAPPGVQRCAALVMVSLQKRLLSSLTAFARTLRVHAEAVQRRYENTESDNFSSRPAQLTLLAQSPDSDDERSGLSEEEVKAEDDGEMSAATIQSATLGNLTPFWFFLNFRTSCF